MASPRDPLVVSSLRKSFTTGILGRKVEVLRGIDLRVREGEIFGLLGKNGAGKTTTLKNVVGLLIPDGGTVEIFGRSPSEPEARRSIGFLPEHPYFYDHLTGREFVEMAGRLHGLPVGEARRRTEELLETVGMTQAADRRIRTYSKGMLQRIGLAQALVGDPALVILDEPLSGLDPVGRRDLKQIIVSLKREGKSVLFSSHILSDVEEICDRVAVLEKGVVVLEDEVVSLLSRGTEGTDVVVAGECQDIGVEGVESQSVPEGTIFRASTDAEVREILTAVLKAGCRVVEVRPRRKTLEELILELEEVRP